MRSVFPSFLLSKPSTTRQFSRGSRNSITTAVVVQKISGACHTSPKKWAILFPVLCNMDVAVSSITDNSCSAAARASGSSMAVILVN